MLRVESDPILGLDFSQVFHNTIIQEKFQNATRISGSTNQEIREKLAAADNDKPIFLIYKGTDGIGQFEYRKNEFDCDQYTLVLATKKFLDLKFSEINEHQVNPRGMAVPDIRENGCHYIFQFVFSKDDPKRCFINVRAVNSELEGNGIMKQSSINAFTMIERAFGNIQVTSHTIHPATWKFFHSPSEYSQLPDKKELNENAFCKKSIEDLFAIHANNHIVSLIGPLSSDAHDKLIESLAKELDDKKWKPSGFGIFKIGQKSEAEVRKILKSPMTSQEKLQSIYILASKYAASPKISKDQELCIALTSIIRNQAGRLNEAPTKTI